MCRSQYIKISSIITLLLVFCNCTRFPFVDSGPIITKMELSPENVDLEVEKGIVAEFKLNKYVDRKNAKNTSFQLFCTLKYNNQYDAVLGDSIVYSVNGKSIYPVHTIVLTKVVTEQFKSDTYNTHFNLPDDNFVGEIYLKNIMIIKNDSRDTTYSDIKLKIIDKGN
jgi:hypothetical protein